MAASADALLPVKKSSSSRKLIGILGTGDYARALSKRLIFSGYDVILGSRRPAGRQLSLYDECLCGVQIVSVDECIAECDVLIVAIHMENFQATLAPRAESLSDKIVVDVSNRTNRYSAVSNAEFLQSLLPSSIVVKAFNTVSAQALEDQTIATANRVFVGSDNPAARQRVMEVARDLGFAPCDMGGLKSARSMEEFVLKVFPGWKVPLFFAFGVFNLWALYCVYLYFIDKTAYRWDQVFLKVLNKPLCMTSVTLLALTYLAGSVAGLVQLYRGTKYRRFPRFLNAWLLSRRQLGLMALALALLHALASAMMLSPTYYRSWFQKAAVVLPPANASDQAVLFVKPAWMVWKGELACLFGLGALLLLVIVGITSLPSVGSTLNWAEWRFVQSKIGVMALFLALAHEVAMGAPGWAKGGWSKTFSSITFLSGLLPAVTLLLRLFLLLPPLGARLKRIRHGWERDATDDSFASASPQVQQCCGSRKSNLKTTSGHLSSHRPVYTAVKLEVEEEEEKKGCSSCQNGAAQTSLPTRTCDCSAV